MKDKPLNIVALKASHAALTGDSNSGLEKPDSVTTWHWLRHDVEDLGLWQHCIVATVNAGAKDPWADAVMYNRLTTGKKVWQPSAKDRENANSWRKRKV